MIHNLLITPLLLLLPLWHFVQALFSLFFAALFIPARLLLRFTPLGALLRKHSHEADCIEHLARESMRMHQCKDDLLLHGKLREFAETVLPRDQHPTWFQNVPKHLRRSIVQHGRLRGTRFAPAPFLLGNTLTEDFVKNAWKNAVDKAVRIGYFTFIFCFASVLLLSKTSLKSSFDDATHSARIVTAQQVADDYNDVFHKKDIESIQSVLSNADKVNSSVQQIDAKIALIVFYFIFLSVGFLSACLIAFAAARMIFIARLRDLVYSASDESVADLRKPFREALQKWRYFLADRETNNAGVNDQVHFAMNIDKSPLVYFGDATGEMEFNGHLLAPRQGHEMCQSIIDMLQHTEVLGGSGESKSRDFYIPLLAQLLDLRKAGYPIATYITDEKGAIVEDVINITKKLGLEDDTIIIGTGANDWRVDLMDVGRPVLIAELIKSASRQAGASSGGDDFWSEMGNDLMLNIWTITEVAEMTSAGQAWNKEHGYRMHSIKNALQLATVDDNLQDVISIALEGLENEYERVAQFDTDAFYAATEYLTANWFSLVDGTKDGIRANLRKALRTFTFKPEIALGFADGAGDKVLSAAELHSNKIKVLNVSQIEHGAAGRLVNIFLKSAFFKQCRDVQQQNPAFADRRLAWWFNPDLQDAKKDDYFLEFFLADEYQSLITSDSSSGYSDATVWNVLRSAGVAGVTISQGVGAYEYAIGKEAAANVRRQWRSKHFLRSEDTNTLEEAKKLVGKTFRFQVSDWNHFESMAAVRRELRTDADNLEKLEWSEDAENTSIFNLHFSDFFENLQSYDEAHKYDDRYHSVTEMGRTLKDAAWRQEDKNAQTMQTGLVDVDVLRDEQIMQMTRGRALTLLQVSGGTQVDIIRLNARAYRRFAQSHDASSAWN